MDWSRASDEHIRKHLAKALRLESIPSYLWNHLNNPKQGWVSDLRAGTHEFEDLLDESKDRLRFAREVLREQGSPRLGRIPAEPKTIKTASDTNRGGELSTETADPSRTSSKMVWWDLTPLGGDVEKRRAEASGEYMAIRATLDEDVQAYRAKLLGGRLLTPEQARDFIASPANQWLPSKWFAEHGVSPTAHRAEWIVDDVGVGLSATGELEEVFYVYEGRMKIGPPEQVLDSNPAFVRNSKLRFEDRRYLYVPPVDGNHVSEDKSIDIGPGSVLDSLRRMAKRLVGEECVYWSEPQAVWFVLTGEAKPAIAVGGRIGESLVQMSDDPDRYQVSINLTLFPWVSGEAVKHAYLKLKKELTGKSANRASEEVGVEIFHFVVKELRAALPEVGISSEDRESFGYVLDKVDGIPTDSKKRKSNSNRPTWNALREKWSRDGAKKRKYRNRDAEYSDGSNFAQTFFRVARSLT